MGMGMGAGGLYAPALGLDSRVAKCAAGLIQYKTKASAQSTRSE
jgi:hypothetical protein